jgi:hypothetical protein
MPVVLQVWIETIKICRLTCGVMYGHHIVSCHLAKDNVCVISFLLLFFLFSHAFIMVRQCLEQCCLVCYIRRNLSHAAVKIKIVPIPPPQRTGIPGVML